jgi:hypothetical protein
MIHQDGNPAESDQQGQGKTHGEPLRARKMISSSVINTGIVASTTAAIPDGKRCSAQNRQL